MAVTRYARLHGHVDDVSAMALEQPFKGFAALGSKAEGERHARQPPGSTAFDFNELRKGEATHVPEREVVLPHHRDKLFSDGLVLLGGRLEGVGDDLPGEQVAGEVDLHPGGAPVAVAVGGKQLGVGLGHGLDRGVLHGNAPERAGISAGKARANALPEEPAQHCGEELRGRLGEAIVDRLAGDGHSGSPRKPHGDLVAGGEPGGHRSGEGSQEDRRVHLGRFADHEKGFPCECVEVGEDEKRGVGRRSSLHGNACRLSRKAKGKLAVI